MVTTFLELLDDRENRGGVSYHLCGCASQATSGMPRATRLLARNAHRNRWIGSWSAVVGNGFLSHGRRKGGLPSASVRWPPSAEEGVRDGGEREPMAVAG
jgi:hypothetical protein